MGAIHFYQQEGFEPIGFDSCCYSNCDLERREVRINMGYFTRKNQKVKRGPKINTSLTLSSFFNIALAKQITPTISSPTHLWE